MSLNPLSTIRAEQPVAVWLGTSFTTLVLRTDVYARSVRRNLSPATDSAELVSDYGRLARPGAPWDTVAPLTLRDQCCEVRIQVATVWHTLFQGLVTADVLQPAGTFAGLGGVQIPNGQVRHACRGVDWLLERITPHQSITEAYGAVAELFAFNGHGSPPERNSSSAKTTDGSGTSRVFAWGTGADLWSSQDIIEYVLRFATANSAYTWVLAGASTALEAVTPQVDPRGKSLRQILAECIRPQDGYAWHVGVAGTTVTITVVSLTDTAVTDLDGGVAIPANTDLLSLAVNLDTDRDITAPVVTPVAESSYKYVDVVSEPIRVIATLKHETSLGAADGFEPAWTVPQAIAFAAADDKERAEDLLRDVYAAFRLPADWTGQDWGGNYIVPAWDPVTATLSWPAGTGKIVPPAIVFERTVPHAATGDPDADQAHPLLGLWDGSAWVQPERDSGADKCTVGLKLSDSGPGIFLRTAHPAQLAPADWGGTSDYSQDWDVHADNFRVTVSFYSHTLLAIRTTAASGSGVKRIYVPGYHLWVCPYAATWSPGQTIAAGTILRDDRAALKRLAAQLSNWYGRTRNTLQYSAAVAPGAVNVGKIVSAMMAATGVTLIGTPVTSETWTWDDRGAFSYGLSTDFADLDITQLSRRKIENTERETSRRIRRLEERLQSVPLREPMAAAAAAGTGGNALLLQITGLHADSPASGVRMYVGNVYGSGSTASPTVTGATVRIPGIAADVVYPSSGVWSDCPVCCAVRTTATWTGATYTHTADTVYEAVGLILIV